MRGRWRDLHRRGVVGIGQGRYPRPMLPASPAPNRVPVARAVRTLLATVLIAALAVLPARAQDAPAGVDPTQDAVARLTVVPTGEQNFDLLTGETTLPQGGTILDTRTGLRLEAAFIRYREGAYIEAQDATADTAGGRLVAPTLSIDVPSLVAVAPDGVRFVRDGLAVHAAAAQLRFGPELARFDAPAGDEPELSARALLLDLRSGDALLLGPYRFQDGPFTLSDEREDAALQVRPVIAEDGTPSYRAANEVDEDLWIRLDPIR